MISRNKQLRLKESEVAQRMEYYIRVYNLRDEAIPGSEVVQDGDPGSHRQLTCMPVVLTVTDKVPQL